MKKIRVLEIIGSMNMGGAETFLMNVLRNINREKFDLYFLCYGNNKFDYEEEVNELGGHIIRIDQVSIKNFCKHINILTDVIKKNNIDVVHAHTYYNSMFSIIAAKRCKIKNIIIHSHNTLSEPNPSLLKRIYFKISKRVINNFSTNFFACGKEAGEALFYKDKKFTIIDNGIIIEDFFYDKDVRDKKRKELNIDGQTIVIGHVGRFDKVKNHRFIIDIIKEYILINSQTKLILIGEGRLKKEIETKVKDSHLDDKVLFLGKRRDVKELYSAMDLLLFPSLFEGLPVTLIEAQANGLPILASSTIDKDVNITKHIVFKKLNDSSDDWAKEINDLINKRYNCQDLLLDSVYNMKTNINKLEKIYENK